MPSTRTLVIGGGQAGLALSWHLQAAGHEHVVLERDVVAARWRTQRWDSLRTLTPNWMARLPGLDDPGPDPDGFAPAAAVADRLAAYAAGAGLPVRTGTTVERATRPDDRYRVVTDCGTWRADALVIATGWCDQPAVPPAATCVPAGVLQCTPADYRNPAQVPAGTVLVVGASATGVQLAAELAAAGRDVVLAVGRHTRLPRTVRGADVFTWLERLGTLDRGLRGPGDPRAGEPSLQLVGRPDRRDLDLGVLQAAGVRLTGRLAGIDRHGVRFAADLATSVGDADERLRHLLDRVDALAGRDAAAHGRALAPAARPASIVVPEHPPARLRFGPGGVQAIVWATGFTRRHPWLHLPVFDGRGEIVQRRGVTPLPGCFTMGMRFQTRRRSTFLDGVRFDAAEVAGHLLGCAPEALAPAS